MALGDLMASLGVTISTGDRRLRDMPVTGVTLRSSDVRPGDLYAALPGARTHGAKYAADAAARGAVAILTDQTGEALLGSWADALAVIVVETPRALLGRAASFVYGAPSQAMTVIGVTGTHGKSTTTQLIAAGRPDSGVVGTLGTWIAGARVPSALTTPEAPDLHALFAVMRQAQVKLCAVEVSSHALVMGRVDEVMFDLAVFTNLGRDHLDFHHTMEAYFEAKATLFTPERSRRALVNADDAYGRRLAASARVPTVTYAVRQAGHDSSAMIDADWISRGLVVGDAGTSFEISGPGGVNLRARVCLPGAFNVSNATAAIAALCQTGHDPADAVAAVGAVTAVPGRMERVDAGQDYAVVVDYAHKPDAVAAVLAALRPVTKGRLTIVLGAGGDRDRGKRPIMGEIAARLADRLIVTDDNPRSEEPAEIRADIVAGIDLALRSKVTEIGDRRAAIAEAIRNAHPGDTVLIAGKGHETGQESNGVVAAFDDRAVAAELIEGGGT